MDASNPNGLFRAEAMNHLTHNLLGKVLVTPKASTSWVSAFLLVWIIAGCIWLCSAQYARQVTVRGWLEPSQGSANHFSSLNQGVVAEVFVSTGDKVVKGQPLMRVKAERRNINGEKFNHLIKQELIQTRSILLAELQRVVAEAEKRALFLEMQKTQISEENAMLQNVLLSTRKQYELAIKNASKIAELHRKKWVSDIEFNSSERQTLEFQTQLGSIERELIQLQRQFDSVNEQLVLLPSSTAQSENQLNQQIADVNQRIIQLDSADSEVIFAQTSGRVSDVYYKIGSKVDSKPLLSINPLNTKLLAILPVPTHASGFIQQGQLLSVRYDAYPHEKFGTHSASIQSMSESILLPNEVANAATKISEPVYLVRAVLEESQIDAYGEKVLLKSGNTFSADIELGQRTILEWLFAPLLSLKGRL